MGSLWFVIHANFVKFNVLPRLTLIGEGLILFSPSYDSKIYKSPITGLRLNVALIVHSGKNSLTK